MAILALGLALAFPVTSRAELPARVAELLRLANIPQEALGVQVFRVADGQSMLSFQAERSLQPASTLKLLTSIVGLERLGPTYRGSTELRSAAEIRDGVLVGDLVLRGGANPDLDWQALERMLRELRHKGIREIRGDLILDREMFQPPRTDLGVPPFDEAPEFRYNVIPDALLLNTNLLQFDLRADASNLFANLTPALERVVLVSAMTLVDRACEKWEDGWQIPVTTKAADGAIRIELRGEFPRNCAISTNINAMDRVDFADRLFRALWAESGGSFSGVARDGKMREGTRVLVTQRSRTLAEFTRDINKRSDNPITRLLYLTLGTLDATPAPITAKRAEQEVHAWLRKNGIGIDGLILENGSGLSRIERIRPSQLAAVLAVAYRSTWAPEFLASLPIVAVDGGMRSRLQGSVAAGHARIKTGSLRDVAAIAGFVPDAYGQPCIIVAMINHPLAKGAVARPILDALVEWVTRSSVLVEMAGG